MAVGLASGVKVCCKCGRDVNGAKRMKDTEGRYWCLYCGEADRQRIERAASGVCAGCGDSHAMSTMTVFSGLPWCEKCLKRRYQKERHGMGKVGGGVGMSMLKRVRYGSGQASARTKKLIATMAVLAVICGAVYWLI